MAGSITTTSLGVDASDPHWAKVDAYLHEVGRREVFKEMFMGFLATVNDGEGFDDFCRRVVSLRNVPDCMSWDDVMALYGGELRAAYKEGMQDADAVRD